MSDMPQYLASGTILGTRYRVEALARRSEGRCFYLGTEGDQRVLLSARFDRDRFEPYLQVYQRRLEHPGLVAPADVFVEGGALYTVVPFTGEGLMVDEPAPLDNDRLLSLGQRILGTLAYLHAQGVCLTTLRRANLMVSPDGTVRLFDLEVERVTEGPVPAASQREVLCAVGELLRRYCDVEADELTDLLLATEVGTMAEVARLGREIERRFETFADIEYPPKVAGMTDVGLRRALNEDNWRWVRLSDHARLYVVADGMGGHDAGEVASALAVNTLCEVARAREAREQNGPAEQGVESLLDESFQIANNTVKDTAVARGTDMGTTMVCTLVLDPPDAESPPVGFVANVGDSRGYLLRQGVLHQITRDHSLVQKMVERGKITREEARVHINSNVLLRTVGTERDVEIDIFRVELAPGDKVLMCSDGLWGEVEDRDMESILNTYDDPRIASRELVRAANQGGGKDNVTLMIVSIS